MEHRRARRLPPPGRPLRHAKQRRTGDITAVARFDLLQTGFQTRLPFFRQRAEVRLAVVLVSSPAPTRHQHDAEAVTGKASSQSQRNAVSDLLREIQERQLASVSPATRKLTECSALFAYAGESGLATNAEQGFGSPRLLPAIQLIRQQGVQFVHLTLRSAPRPTRLATS